MGIYVDRDVEMSYQQCRFRWFQLTQSVRRSRSAFSTISGSRKLKPSSRFLVLNAMRTEADPAAPRSNIEKRSSLLLQNGATSAAEETAAVAAAAAMNLSRDKEESSTIETGFSAW